jgi:hypothetical protein
LQKFRKEFEAYVRGERKKVYAKLTAVPWS